MPDSSMRSFTLSELSRMQTTQESGMMDTCTLLKHTEGAINEYGMPITGFVEGAVLPCGYDGRRQIEAGVPGGTPLTQVVLTDGRMRLPIDTEISNLDRLMLTHRFGVLFEQAITFELAGEPRRGPSGLVVDVKRVVTHG